MNFSVIIPSKDVSNLDKSYQAAIAAEPHARIIIVDDGIEFNEDCDLFDFGDAQWVNGEKPFIFSRNVNLGIRAAFADHKSCWNDWTYPPSDGVVILNDDALLQTPGGFSLLARAAEEHPEYGLISSSCNNVGNLNQRPKGIGGLRDEPRMVCFVAVYIPRRTIEAVGLLDEQFTGYGFDDDDYCYRVRRAGLKIGIHDGCFVDHASLKSSFRGNPAAPASLVDGRAIFVAKWGAHPL